MERKMPSRSTTFAVPKVELEENKEAFECEQKCKVILYFPMTNSIDRY
jgi:hypothetical protein